MTVGLRYVLLLSVEIKNQIFYSINGRKATFVLAHDVTEGVVLVAGSRFEKCHLRTHAPFDPDCIVYLIFAIRYTLFTTFHAGMRIFHLFRF